MAGTLTFALPYFVGQQSDTTPIEGASYDQYEQQTAAFLALSEAPNAGEQ